MSAEALPYTLLILLVELAIGGLRVVWLADLRGCAALSFIKFGVALSSVGMRVMQSATELLYIAMALILSGEVLAKGLLFVTAVPNWPA